MANLNRNSISQSLTSWLMENGGPIIRWRVAVELADTFTESEKALLLEELLGSPEVQRWLGLLGTGPIHHGKDSSSENCLAKLAEYGLRAGMPALDEKTLPLCSKDVLKTDYDDFILLPFLVRVGYTDQPMVGAWFEKRLEGLVRTAELNTYAIYMDEIEKENVPPSLRTKRLYKPHFNGQYPLPSCYDFYTIAYAYEHYPADRDVIDKVIAYLLDGRYQTTPGGYQWNAEKRRHYAAGRGYLATLPVVVPVPSWEVEPVVETSGKGGVVYPDASRLLIFLEAGAKLPLVRQSEWFQVHLQQLESFKKDSGRYEFPRGYLLERQGYYLYAGSHLGLGENRRKRDWAEIESTFRMLYLKKLVGS